MKEQKEELRRILEETRARVDESFEELRERTGGTESLERWVRANPVVAALAAGGAGLLIGRLIAEFRPGRVREPASLVDRIEARAQEIARQRAKEGRQTPEDRVKQARDRARAAAEEARSEGVRRFEETRQALSDRLTDAVSKAALAFLAKKAGDWVKDKSGRKG
jgi:ElaB/YqjD/DUF883 family membrane-anchored ribosome-binding protein